MRLLWIHDTIYYGTDEYIFKSPNLITPGEQILNDVTKSAEESNNRLYLCKAQLVLGELLHEQGRNDEAIVWLKKVVRLKPSDKEDDLLDQEQKQAAELLEAITQNKKLE